MNNEVQTNKESAGVLDSTEFAMKAAKKLAQGNLGVFSAELGAVMAKLRPKLTGLAFSGLLIALGLISFLAFLIIGLGALLDDRYWLSSLLSAAFCCLIGGPLFVRSLGGISALFQFEKTRRSVDRTVEAAKQTYEEIKGATLGENRESITTGKH